MDAKNYTFRITNGKGFQIKFDNGLVLSTQFGPGNYCQNRKASLSCGGNGNEQSTNAEIAVINHKGDFITQQAWTSIFGELLSDDVTGWANLNEWLALVEWCKSR